MSNMGMGTQAAAAASASRFTVQSIAEGIWAVEEPLEGEIVRSFVIEGQEQVALLDTGGGIDDFAAVVRSLSIRPPVVLHSHSHWDHIGGSYAFERVLIHASEAADLRDGLPNAVYRTIFTPAYVNAHPLPPSFDLDTASIPGVEPSGFLNHGDRIDLGGRTLSVFHTPGHSPGGITFLDSATGLLFPGDAVNLGPMYLYYPSCDPAAWRATIRLLADLASDATGVYPSHDAAPLTGAQVAAVCDAYEEVWAGTRPITSQSENTSEGHPILVDTFDCGFVQFQLPHGRYGHDSAS